MKLLNFQGGKSKVKRPDKVEVALIGSCTNSSYEDISRAVSLAQQVTDKGLKLNAEFTITPGSEQVRYTVERDGYLDVFNNIGATVFANACGPCIGMWARVGAEKAEKNTIVHSFNRNFAKRNVPIIFYFDGIHEDYHKVTDEVSKIEFPLLRQRTQCVFYTAWELANRDKRISIDKGTR